jgi:lactoylglutathione lyase
VSANTSVASSISSNVEQAVPFFMVSSMEDSLRFYVEGLGFRKTQEWLDEGRLRWCWLQIGRAALMLQEYRPSHAPSEKLGAGVSVCFMCKDALELYREASARGIQSKEPFVGNRLWVVSFADPDGYKVDFESPTDASEEMTLSEWKALAE